MSTIPANGGSTCLVQAAGRRHHTERHATGHSTGLVAVIEGVVADGWLKDNQVVGEYTQITCSPDDPTDCFQGTITILRGSKD